MWARLRATATASSAFGRGREEGLAQGEARGRQQADVELATSRERLSNVHAEVSRLTAELNNLEALQQSQQGELSTLRQQRAQLQVHADRVGPLESQLALAHQQLQVLNDAASMTKAELAATEPQLVRLAELSSELEACQLRLSSLHEEHAKTRETAAERATLVESLTTQVVEQRSALEKAATQRDAFEAEMSKNAATVADLTARIEGEQSQSADKIRLLQDAREQLSAQFLNIANQVLEDKSQRFTQQNQDNLGAMLLPLHERIREFQQQVSTTYDVESKERLTLKNEIERLAKLNSKISEDAVNLTQALKGSNKTQGIWGEMVLETVLEASGLRKGEAYTVQASFENVDGQQQRPDVVINLPERKHLVVDSKVSLVAYERYCSAPDDAVRASALKEHLQSLRLHVKGLSDKNYPGLQDLKTPDFVLLFIPIEPAFMLAVTEDHALFNEAYARNVMLVSPTTLLATLRTIANIWRHEYQNRNAQAIAEQCAKLYDKFVGFVGDLEQVGRHLGQTQKAYDEAQKKLSIGPGNLVNQVAKVKKLGVRPNKALPALLEESAEATDESANQPMLVSG
jgi:DNA recombination protein RmuC